ncbi:MAG: DUF6056 family protein [Dysgonomonas sp.]|nr:DUF6056 family protein [Dysgonomonas sp.]
MDISFFIKKKFSYVKNRFEALSLRLEYLVQYLHQHKKTHNFLFLLCLVFIFGVIFFFNYKTPMIGDDYPYSFIFETSTRISSFADIVESQYLHYYGWGGRAVAHTIVQLLLLTNNSLLIDVVNSLAFVLFIFLLYLNIVGHKSGGIRLLIVVFTSIWILQPAFAETTLWITGSANYLWGTLIILAFLLPYRLYGGDVLLGNMKNVVFSIAMFVFGIIAGWTNENTAAGLIVMIVAYIIYYKYKKQKITPYLYCGLIGAIIGYILMIAAPGNFVRAEGTGFSPFVVIYRILMATRSLVYYVGALNLGIAILLILYLKFTEANTRLVIPFVIIYYVGWFVSIYVMAGSPGFPARAWFGPITLNIVIFGILLFHQNYNLRFLSQIRNSIAVLCISFFLFTLYDALRDIVVIDRIWKERMVVLNQKKKEGAEKVIFKEYQAKTKFGLGDAAYAKKYMSNYYGIEFELE